MRVSARRALPLAGLAAVAYAAACAKIEAPPGGPRDVAPPRLIATLPDSLAVLPAFDGEVEFRFDEVVSEGGTASQGTGTGDLERLVILSPTTRVPEVRWRRNRITVRPREGWQPNRVYRVELLPGVLDLRNNRATGTGAVVTFTTGAPAPGTTLRGRVFDWVTGRPAAGALVEAVLVADSLPYRAAADSAGRFVLGPLPAGEYLVYGSLDQNRNFRREQREVFDTVRLAAGSTGPIELWTFPRDTVGPRMTIARLDSVSATLTFTQPLDPRQRLDSSAVSVRLLPDSTPVHVIAVRTRAEQDSAAARERAARDTTRRADSAAVPAPGQRADSAGAPSRQALNDRLIVQVATPLAPGSRYVIEVRGIRNVNGAAASPAAVLAIPAAPAIPSADSTAADSAVRDSLPAGPARPRPRDTLPAAPR